MKGRYWKEVGKEGRKSWGEKVGEKRKACW